MFSASACQQESPIVPQFLVSRRYPVPSHISQPHGEKRVQVVSIQHTQGQRLRTVAGDPKVVASAVLDVVIALYGLFLKGWLHRDITAANMLIADTIREYPKENLPEKIKSNAKLAKFLGRSRGLVIDADIAVRYKEEREISKYHSGSLPFISRRSLANWDSEDLQHTAMDDLESVVWVILWEALHASEARTKTEEEFLTFLQDTSVCEQGKGKASIRDDLRPGAFLHPDDFSEPVKSLVPLLSFLFSLSTAAEGAIKRCFWECAKSDYEVGGRQYWEELDRVCDRYFHRYMDIIVKFLEFGKLELGLPFPCCGAICGCRDDKDRV